MLVMFRMARREISCQKNYLNIVLLQACLLGYLQNISSQVFVHFLYSNFTWQRSATSSLSQNIFDLFEDWQIIKKHPPLKKRTSEISQIM